MNDIIKDVRLSELKPYSDNYLNHEKNVEHIKNSIRDFGFNKASIVVDETMTLLAGHGTLLALQELKYDVVPYVVVVNGLHPKQKAAYRIADNSSAKAAELLDEKIKKELDLIGDDFNLNDYGFDFELPESMKDSDESDDVVPEVVENPRINVGDLIELGEHRLYCGDCTNEKNVETLMNGEKADMVFTDPPYGMNLNTDYSNYSNKLDFVVSAGGKTHNKVIGDEKEFNAQLILPLFDYCKEIFLWGADYYVETIGRTHDNLGSWFVWDKRTNEGTGIEQCELNDKQFGSGFELCWSKSAHKRLIVRVRSGIFGVCNEQGNKVIVHPTQKPVQLSEWFLDKYSNENQKIIDLFGGSGSTLIACEKTKRKCYMMELEPVYCDVIVQRWCDYTGNNDIKINGEGVSWEQVNRRNIIGIK